MLGIDIGNDKENFWTINKNGEKTGITGAEKMKMHVMTHRVTCNEEQSSFATEME